MERLQEEGITGLLSRLEPTQERRMGWGAKLLNWEKHLERTGPERKGKAGKAREGFVGWTRQDIQNRIPRCAGLRVVLSQ